MVVVNQGIALAAVDVLGVGEFGGRGDGEAAFGNHFAAEAVI